MRLERLKIINTVENTIIRNIKFNHRGLSLIVDESDRVTSGSNIGKTTAVKVIDLCLGAKSVTSLYKEKDTGENVVVKEFLNNNKVIAELHVTINNKPHILKRDLYQKGKYEIDGEYIGSINQYNEELNKLIFANISNKPSFRELITKFIRLEELNENSLLKYLGNYKKTYQYQAIYEYLYGIDTSKSENIDIVSLNDAIYKDIDVIYRKNGVSSINEFEAKIRLLERETERLKSEYQKVSIIDDFENKKEYIDILLNDVSKLEQLLSKSKLQVDLMNEKIKKEKSKIFTVDHKILKKLYEETGLILDKQLKDFEDLEKFHNGMVNKRIEMLEESLSNKKDEVNIIQSNLNEYRKEYEANYVTFNSELRETFEEKVNEYSESKISLDNAKNDYKYILKKLLEIKDNSSKKVEEHDNKEKKKEIEERLNYYFDELTNSIIGEPFTIVLSEKEDKFPVEIIGMKGKPGTGIKKAMITCFDLAHINLILEKNYFMPVFEIHDKLENIDLKELKNIVQEARKFKGQYIFPILKDRISELGIKPEEIVLRLSNQDKFFKQ